MFQSVKSTLPFVSGQNGKQQNNNWYMSFGAFSLQTVLSVSEPVKIDAFVLEVPSSETYLCTYQAITFYLFDIH